jgi:sulfatase modifying factor 1
MQERATRLPFPTIICLLAACGGNSSSGGAGGVAGNAVTGGRGSGTGGSAMAGGTSGTGGVAGATGGSSTNAGGSGSGGSSPTPPSCQSEGLGLSDCGPSHESCCTTPKVAGGTFYRTYTNDGSGATGKADPATISDFRLDKYLVTVGRFRQFVAAWNSGSGYTPPAGSGKHTHLNAGKGLADSGEPGGFETGWLTSDNDYITPTNQNLITCNDQFTTWTMTAGSQENLPMNCVNWYEAYAFCIWDGGFMPSETEFEYASAGGSQQREYPWGSTDPGTTNKYAIWNCNYGSDPGNCTDQTNIAPVGAATLGAGLWGQLDLVGNLLEWNLDYSVPYVNPCMDCAYVAGGSGRVIRGGYFQSSEVSNLDSSYRNEGIYATDRRDAAGFRCARSP